MRFKNKCATNQCKLKLICISCHVQKQNKLQNVYLYKLLYLCICNTYNKISRYKHKIIIIVIFYLSYFVILKFLLMFIVCTHVFTKDVTKKISLIFLFKLFWCLPFRSFLLIGNLILVSNTINFFVDIIYISIIIKYYFFIAE